MDRPIDEIEDEEGHIEIRERIVASVTVLDVDGRLVSARATSASV